MRYGIIVNREGYEPRFVMDGLNKEQAYMALKEIAFAFGELDQINTIEKDEDQDVKSTSIEVTGADQADLFVVTFSLVGRE